MSDGIEGATQAFAESLGEGSEAPVARRDRDFQDRGPVERIVHPTVENYDPDADRAGGDDIDDGEDGGDDGRRTQDRDADGRFRSRDRQSGDDREGGRRQENRSRQMSLHEALEDPLDEDEDESQHEDGAGDRDGERGRDGDRQNNRPISLRDLDPEQEVEVNIDGKPHKVSVREALDGYIRTETFHRRLTDFDKVVKETRTHRNEIDGLRVQYTNKIAELQKQLDLVTPKEPNWDQLFADNPVEAAQLQRQWNTFHQSRAKLNEEAQQEQQRVQQANQQQYNEFVSDQNSLFIAKHPEYNDPTRGEKLWKRDREGMVSYAKELGFSDQEINNVVDARYMSVLLDASKYRRLQKRSAELNPTPRNDPPRRNAGGASRTPAKPNSARSRLAKTGLVRDAASVIEEQLRREG